MSSIVGWTPPSFHPDGTLTAAEQAPKPNTLITWGSNTITTPGRNHNDLARAAEEGVGVARGVGNRGVGSEPPTATRTAATVEDVPSDAAVLQWGHKPPCCALIFGGLNSMYVNPEVWVLPLRWSEKAVQLSPPQPEPEPRQYENGDNFGGGNRLGFATAVNIKTAGAVAQATAGGRAAPVAVDRRSARTEETIVDAAGGNRVGDGTWRLFQAGGGFRAGAGSLRQRRASLPCNFSAEVAGRMSNNLSSTHEQQQQRHQLHETRDSVGGQFDGVVRREADEDRGEMPESAAEIEVSEKLGWVCLLSWKEEAEGESTDQRDGESRTSVVEVLSLPPPLQPPASVQHHDRSPEDISYIYAVAFHYWSFRSLKLVT